MQVQKFPLLVLLFAMGFFTHVFSQDQNINFPVSEIEQKLQYGDYHIIRVAPVRFPGDIVMRLILRWPDDVAMQVKLKRTPPGGEVSNNSPRYEIAAYQLQKMFLDESEYVVPPTAARSVTLATYLEQFPEIQVYPTFGDSTVMFVLQYWIENVSSKNVYDKQRYGEDATYAKYLENMNIFAYLLRHNDSNTGNFLISTVMANPRVFVPDNGLAFESHDSRRGTYWREIRFAKLPERTISRLRAISVDDLRTNLGVVAQFEFQGALLMPVSISENLAPDRGVRLTSGTVQFGLNDDEITGIYDRIQHLLTLVDSGKIKTY